MSYSEQTLSVAQKFGCLVYAIIGGLISSYFMVGAALGDCASENECISETSRTLMFYGTPLITLIGGVLLTKYFMRDKN